MRRTRLLSRVCWLAAIGLAGPSPTSAAEARFAAAPTAARQGRTHEITFSLAAPGDVEVAILNARGQTVRHLAAGVLGGENDPPPPLTKGLTQKLVWDGLDDAGQPATGGPFEVRLRAGMQAKFGRLLGGSPYTGGVVSMPYRAPVNGLAVDGEGGLYVKLMSAVGSHGNSGMWPWHLRKFNAQGEYQRTVLPYPASTPPAAAHGFDLLPRPEGRFAPALRTSLYPVFSVFGNEVLPRLVEGKLAFVHSERLRLNLFALDGTNAIQEIPLWPDKGQPIVKLPSWLDIQAAYSPDGRYVYLSNVAATAYDGKQPSDIDPAWPQGRLYRFDTTRPDRNPEPFFDLALPNWEQEKYWQPSAWDKKTAAAGVDTDAEGRLLVGDLVNQQVVEISPQGQKLSATPVPWPDKVLVSRRTGALYVVSRKVSRGYLPPATLYKIEGRGATAKIVAEMPLKGTIGGAAALDESRETPVLWLSGQESETQPGGGRLLRVEDRGAELKVTQADVLNRDPNAITFVGYMDVDPEAEYVYVTKNGGTVWRFHGESGEGGPLPFPAVDVAIGPRGDIFAWGTGSYDGPIARYTRALEPIPAPGGDGANTYGKLFGRAGRGQSVCGFDVDAKGQVFATVGSNDCHVRGYDAQGKLLNFPRQSGANNETREAVPAAISGVSGYGGSLRVDRAGNLYLLQGGLPKEHQPPPGYEKDEAYRQAVGTIYKFPPQGGEILTKDWKPQEVVGSIASYAGCGPVSRWNAVGSCVCTKPRFDVDDFGRLYIPNAVTYSVSVRDNAGNVILEFGDYGNFDSQGPGSREPRPEIPLGWPVAAGASDRAIYVGDCLNHRVVRVDKRFAAEATVKLAE